jgi:hypothetical protein
MSIKQLVFQQQRLFYSSIIRAKAQYNECRITPALRLGLCHPMKSQGFSPDNNVPDFLLLKKYIPVFSINIENSVNL